MPIDILPTQLRCEHLANPLGIDVSHPRLSWILESNQRGQRQTAYQILVASSPEQLADDQGDLWDSGKVSSDQSVYVAYAGKRLGSSERAWWKVRVWDKDGQPSAYSEPAWWELGLLDRGEWRGAWIGAALAGGPHTTSPAPFLRTQFTIGQPVARARLYITALGLYEPHLNGQVVGDDVLTPGWTDYDIRVQYQVYDVTELLRPGENVLGAILGDGWYAGYVGWLERQRYGDRPWLLAQLAITYADGSSEIIASGDGWKTAYGPILESDMIMGESYDARREEIGWDAPGYDDARWRPVETLADPGIALTAMRGPTVRRIQEIRPIADPAEIKEGPRSRWIFDMGQNMVGWLRLKVSGPAGSTITMRHAEVLNPDGTLYTTNLRTARQTDHYTLKGEGQEVWEPRFTFHGFRYVELSGLTSAPARDTITGVVVHSDMAPTGSFSCSDPLITQLQHNIEWGQRGNFVDVPTDCPQRNERLGWTGDAQVFIRTAAYNFDVAGFFAKWTRDVEDAQSPAGAYPNVVPNPVARRDAATTWPNAAVDGGPAWADAGVICPWTIYQCYGDAGILAERYDSMRRYVEFQRATSRDGLRCYADYQGWHGYGDWLALDGSSDRFGNSSKELLGTAFFAYSSSLLARIAGVLGKRKDAERYQALFEEVRRAFQERFVTQRGLIGGATQTSYVLALHFDLLPTELRATAIDELVRDIERRGNHLSTGFVGTPYLATVLSENGRADVAYKLLKQTSWPSWLYSVTQGATTIWERWDGWTHDKGFQDPSMNSFNHYAYGAIGAWMYASIGGIDVDPEHPGYKHIVMRPRPGGELTSASAELRSVHGPIRSSWTLKGGRFDWRISIPANTSATVYVPAAAGAEVREGGASADGAAGVRLLRREADAAVYEVDAGEYQFSAG
ncbi:MAG TPA: glycoside hydrolase family 78 protein [Roseiflexaceae bacterium]|nr:glycoside hydrolase family 78 protein [Roseiflexaceae bacterium]